MDEHAKVSEVEAAYDNPPKNFVREKWVQAAERRKGRNGVSHINYLTFPGPTCLDVKLFQECGLIRMKGQVYDEAYLTFCEHNSLKFGLIRKELPNAKDVNLSFEDLVGAGQPGYFHPWLHSKRLFPYDVVNLDFEGPPFVLRDRPYSRQVAAIEKVFALQKEHKRSFTLFATFPAENGQLDTGGEAMLRETIRSNIEVGPPAFAAQYRVLYGSDDTLPGPLYQGCMVVVPKLILRAGGREGFEVSCDARYTYVGRPKTVTRMVSFIFDCEFRGGVLHLQPPLFNALQQHYEVELLKLLEEDFVDVNECLEAGKRE